MIRSLVVFACAVAAANVVLAASKDEQALRAQTVAWEKAYNGGDVKGVAAQYAEDALLAPPNAPAVRGRAAIEKFFAKDIADTRAAGVVFAIDQPTQVGVSGSMGWESGTYKATIKGNVVETGKFLSVSRKKDRKWLYIRDTWNADAPPAPAAPAPAPSAPAKKP
jgi:ketosteroid isomerase-like protein